jgi:peptide methionine sulfoxide reductase msrA/msrB
MNMFRWLGAGLVAASLVGCSLQSGDNVSTSPAPESKKDLSGTRVATFAGGCFWCVEADFEKVPGVVAAISGYSGGTEPDPSYSEVASGRTGHVEAVRVHYDPTIITYEGLLQAFWRMVDPTDPGGQFSDRGKQYATAIFYHDEDQRRIAERSLAELADTGRYDEPLVTPIQPAMTFYTAEDYHQDYYRRNSLRYGFYRRGSGRDRYLDDVWDDDLTVDFGRYSPASRQASSQAGER